MPQPTQPAAPSTRLDAFVDAAFAFATTMLVISIDSVPENYEELIRALKGTPAFLASFVGIIGFWIGHKSWSRRYAVEDDPLCVGLSLLLVFLVMVFVYPLKVISSAFFAWVSGGWLPANFRLDDPLHLIGIFAIYGVGFFALAGTLAALYWRAMQRSDSSAHAHARLEAAVWLTMALTGVVSALWAVLLPPSLGIWAGFVYCTLFVTTPVVSHWLAPPAAVENAQEEAASS